VAKFLVTGGAGFIGSNLVDALVSAGDHVRVLDDLSSGKIENLEANLGTIELLEGDVSDRSAVGRAIDGVDYVLHHAALASVPKSVEDPWRNHQVNVNGTLFLLLAAREAGVKRFVLASSSAIYGEGEESPKREELEAAPLSPYATSKLVGEYYCGQFTACNWVPTVSLRYFNIFGPRQDPGSDYAAVVPIFIKRLLEGKPRVLHGQHALSAHRGRAWFQTGAGLRPSPGWGCEALARLDRPSQGSPAIRAQDRLRPGARANRRLVSDAAKPRWRPRGSMSRPDSRVVLVDDDRMFRKILTHSLSERGYRVEELDGTGNVAERIRALLPDVVLLDLNMPGKDGLRLLRELVESDLDCRIIMVTGTEDVSMAVRAIRAGAFDYVTKPVKLEELLVSMERAIDSVRVTRERDLYRDRYDQRFSYVESRNLAMRKIYDLARKLARGETTTVLIQGESGTGKEHVANLIHQLSPRKDKPFLEVNCASLPEQLLESELFGHEKGAFTDASTRKRGLLELADGGTLFLDEVGEMALPIQGKLLRVLERTMFRRVGGTEDIEVSVRIISATNRDLTKAVANGTFREDLLFRLKVVPVQLPPLRDRPEDVMALGMHFLHEFSGAFGKLFHGLSADAREALQEYTWPGNVRELRNCMERAVLLHEGTEMTAAMLQIPGSTPVSPEEGVTEFLAALREITEKGIPERGIDFEHLVNSVERFLITKASEKAGWNQSQAARYLQLNRDKLRTRMKNHRLEKRAHSD
jgi:DNA-binding NtrC family response regulator